MDRQTYCLHASPCVVPKSKLYWTLEGRFLTTREHAALQGIWSCEDSLGASAVSDYSGECCFAAVHGRLVDTLKVAGSSWGDVFEKLPKEDGRLFQQDFLETVGARHTSQGVHWPMIVPLRASTKGRSSGFRQRTRESKERRDRKKAKKGLGQLAKAAPAAQSKRP